MRKLLVLAFFSLMFTVTQASVRVYSPDVGYELGITQGQPVITMPSMESDCQYVCNAQLNAPEVIMKPVAAIYSIVETKIKDVVLTAYRNPDYGLNSKYGINLCTNTEMVNVDGLVTTRHII